MERNVSRKSIAEIAGVSKTTVTRVMNGSDSVSEKTREKVLSVISEYGYTQNKLALNVSNNKNSNFVAMFVPDMSNYYYLEVFNHMVSLFEDYDYTISVYLVTKHNFSKILNKVLENRVSAIINLAFVPMSESDLKKIRCANIKVIHPGLHEDPVKISIDYLPAIREAFEGMVARGAKKFYFLCGADESFLRDNRIVSYLSLMKENGQAEPEKTVLMGEYPEISALNAGYETVAKLLESGEKPDGLFCMNDMMAIGAMRALREAGIEIGKEAFVVGFDNILLGQYSATSLGTIDSFIEKEARQYVDYVLGRPGGTKSIVSRYIPRASAGTPPAEDNPRQS